jgi:hypothetical protein
MIICPNCQYKEMSGAIYCSKCGGQLIDMNIATHKIHTAEARQVAKHDSDHIQQPPPAHLQSWISLNMVESGQILPLADRTSLLWDGQLTANPSSRMWTCPPTMLMLTVSRAFMLF